MYTDTNGLSFGLRSARDSYFDNHSFVVLVGDLGAQNYERGRDGRRRQETQRADRNLRAGKISRSVVRRPCDTSVAHEPSFRKTDKTVYSLLSRGQASKNKNKENRT